MLELAILVSGQNTGFRDIKGTQGIHTPKYTC